MILANARIAAGGQALVPGWLKVERGRISELGSGTPNGPADRDMNGHWLVPGFVDMHVHGAAGFSFDEATSTAVDAITGHHLAHGTTTMLASLVSARVDVLEDRLRALALYVANGTLAGVHLEGPFLSARHCGAHDPQALRAPDRTAITALLDAAPGSLRMMTLAPELPEAISAIEQITAAGVVAAIGHTSADYETTLAAIAAGASVATHLYNGMPPILGRAPGPVAALLDHESVTIELISDGVHLHPATVRRTAAAATGRLALITDAMAATGSADGEYLLGSLKVKVTAGRAELSDGSSLAGSTLTMDRALRTAVQCGVPFLDALAAVTSTPARALGLDGSCGQIAIGRSADLVHLDDDLTVRGVMQRGRWVPATAARSARMPSGQPACHRT